MPLVSVSVLNYKQPEYVSECIRMLSRQTYPNVEIIFTDNGSADGSVEFVRTHYPEVKVIAHDSNIYYCRAHNIAIRESQGEYVMPLNADVVATESFIEEMAAAMGMDPKVGMVSGKLLRMHKNLTVYDPPIIDSTGLYFSPSMRHFDRGAGEKDEGQYDRVEYVFGPCGAAGLYRRDMLEDISLDGEYLDEDFVIYREDADLAWQAQLCGWGGLYNPRAVAFHRRQVRPHQSRRDHKPELNMHSVKNRFLMRIKNQTWRNTLRFLLPTLWRDIQVFGYVVLVERSSLPAFSRVARLLPRMLAKRRQIMSRKRASDRYMARWFAYRPASYSFSAAEESG